MGFPGSGAKVAVWLATCQPTRIRSVNAPPSMALTHYQPAGFFDETFAPDGRPRTGCQAMVTRLQDLTEGELDRLQKSADAAMLQMGITFQVYGDEQTNERIFPFDILPRLIRFEEWRRVERGLQQRIKALNLFLDDVYNGQEILHAGKLPRELIDTATSLRTQCRGLKPPKGIWCHITGTDLVRDSDGTIYVLEDNLRVPSGVSYVLENRAIMKRVFPKIFEGFQIASVEDYPERLLATLQYVASDHADDPTIVVLTPGVYNSAYFEHSFLAHEMGVELVQGSDLVVQDRVCYMRTTRGLRRVDVIYRRIDDDFLDPLAFRPDSVLGVPGLMEAYRAGNVTLANAPGNGLADDKAVYAYVPEIIRFYLGEDPILPNVPTYVCNDPEQLEWVLAHLGELVVKPTNESGGYGLLIGPRAGEEQIETFRALLKEDPRNYIAQPTLALSTVPTLIGESVEPRHVDLRPFILHGEQTWILPGGLTRVALKKDSLIVNSSQGGGSKDTWVLAGDQQVNVEVS
jgi:uncharacterized circularly permuted ATP-grasp superfamily protein